MKEEQEGFPITALREIKLLKCLKHPNVVELTEMAVELEGPQLPASSFKESRHRDRKVKAFYMVFPYLDHDLTGLLESEAVLDTRHLKCYARQLFEGLAYLHRSGVLHRDMKGSNMLISGGGVLQIADFGLARPLEAGRERYTPGVVTRWYRPPELLLGCSKYGPEVDVWGAGCILAELFLRRPLFPSEDDLQQLDMVSKLCGSINATTLGPISADCPDLKTFQGKACMKKFKELLSKGPANDPLLADLLELCLQVDPRKRLTAEQVLNTNSLQRPLCPANPKSKAPLRLWLLFYLSPRYLMRFFFYRIPSFRPCHEYDIIKKNMQEVEEKGRERAQAPQSGGALGGVRQARRGSSVVAHGHDRAGRQGGAARRDHYYGEHQQSWAPHAPAPRYLPYERTARRGTGPCATRMFRHTSTTKGRPEGGVDFIPAHQRDRLDYYDDNAYGGGGGRAGVRARVRRLRLRARA